MTNPAADLALLLSSWATNDQPPVDARGGVHPGDAAFWRSMGDAVEKLREIDAALESLQRAGIDVSIYDDAVAAWYRGVFSYHQAWDTRTTAIAVDANALGMLRALSVTLQFGATAGVFTEKQRRTIGDCVNEAMELLQEAGEGLSAAETAYLYRVLDSVRSVVEGKAVLGAVDLQAVIDQLVGALAGLAAQFQNLDGDDSRSKKVLGVIGRIIKTTRSVTYDAAALASIGGSVVTVAQALGQ
jgi:hypothetical protein